MNYYEDFEFSSPLSVAEALERLGKQELNAQKGSFYGSVKGNHFSVQYESGKTRLNPQLSGYVLPEGAGCRVFMRAQLVGALDNFFYFFVTCLGAFVYLMVRELDIALATMQFIKQHYKLLICCIVILLVATVVLSNWILNKFWKEGRFQMISSFKEYLNAGFEQGI